MTFSLLVSSVKSLLRNSSISNSKYMKYPLTMNEMETERSKYLTLQFGLERK